MEKSKPDKPVLIKKIILLGQPRTGKTSIIKWYIEGAFEEDTEQPTIYNSHKLKNVELDSHLVQCQLWDVNCYDRNAPG